jgi:hypothetical protein
VSIHSDSGNLNVPDNDLVLMRYSDALLESRSDCKRWLWFWICAIMTSLATRVGSTPAAVTLDGIYAERGRTLVGRLET